MAKKQKKNKKWLYWLLMLVFFVAAAVIVYLVWNAYFKNKDDGQGTSVTTETVEVEKEKKSQKQDESGVVEKEKVVQYEGQYNGGDPNNGDELTGVVTYAGVNSDVLMIRVNIDQYLSSGGCDLALIQDGDTVYNSTVGIIDSAMTATCEGFNVPVSELGNGMTQIIIKLNADGKSGVIMGEVNL